MESTALKASLELYSQQVNSGFEAKIEELERMHVEEMKREREAHDKVVKQCMTQLEQVQESADAKDREVAAIQAVIKSNAATTEGIAALKKQLAVAQKHMWSTEAREKQAVAAARSEERMEASLEVWSAREKELSRARLEAREEVAEELASVKSELASMMTGSIDAQPMQQSALFRIQVLKAELVEVRAKHKKDVSAINAKHRTKMTEMREKAARDVAQLRSDAKEQLSTQKKKATDEIVKIRADSRESLTNLNKSFKDQVRQYKRNWAEKMEKLRKTKEDQINKMAKEITSLRQQNKTLRSSKGVNTDADASREIIELRLVRKENMSLIKQIKIRKNETVDGMLEDHLEDHDEAYEGCEAFFGPRPLVRDHTLDKVSLDDPPLIQNEYADMTMWQACLQDGDVIQIKKAPAPSKGAAIQMFEIAD